MSKQLTIGLAIFGACVVLAVGCGVGAYCYASWVKTEQAAAEAAKVEEYKASVSKFADIIRRSVGPLELIDRLQAKVWYNAIHEKRDAETDAFTTTEEVYVLPHLGTLKGRDFVDFNTALRNLYRDDAFRELHGAAVSMVDEFAITMSILHDPPPGCERLHDAVVDLYTAYTAYADIILNAEGSYNTYTANVNAAKLELKKQLSIMETYITTTEEED